MGLCIAESLLACGEFNPLDLRLRFAQWWSTGYCNAFGFDEHKRSSVGLGGNISASFTEFRKFQTEYTKAGDSKTSGNGSVMRLAPIPIFYHNNIDEAMEFAAKSSKTTHQGSQECFLTLQEMKQLNVVDFLHL